MTKRSELSIPGIYTITHIASGKVYVGQTINFRVRWMNHRRELRDNRHRNYLLQRAWNKHGAGGFVFAVHTDLSHVPAAELAEALAKAEYAALASFSRTYNLNEAGETRVEFSQTTRELLSKRRVEMWADPAIRAKRSAQTKALYTDPAWKAKRDEAMRQAKRTSENRAAVGAHFTALWQSGEHREAQSAKRTANWQDPAYVAQQSASRAASWQDPVKRQKRIDGMKAAWVKRRAKNGTGKAD